MSEPMSEERLAELERRAIARSALDERELEVVELVAEVRRLQSDVARLDSEVWEYVGKEQSYIARLNEHIGLKQEAVARVAELDAEHERAQRVAVALEQELGEMTEEFHAAIPSPDDRTRPRPVGAGWTADRAEALVDARAWAEYGGKLVRRYVSSPEWVEER